MDFKWDVCFSFAGEDRAYVEQVASSTRARGISVFYDDYYRVELWGRDLYVHLDEVYRKKSHYCVLFVSSHYAKKLWTNHERRSAQARAFIENSEYILPARFDNTEIPGIPPTVGYIDLNDFSPEEFADIIAEKVLEGIKDTTDEISQSNKQFSFFSDPLLIPGVQWPANELMETTSSFQLLPVNYKSQRVEEVIHFTLKIIENLFDNSNNCWTYGGDRDFDRRYVTTSVLTYLFQLGLTDKESIIDSALQYIDKCQDLSIDNRSVVFFNIAFHRMDETSIIKFLENLKDYQYTDKTSPLYGSFLFSQGEALKNNLQTDNWQLQRYHKEGATFHACYIADNLLHLQSGFNDAKQEAQQILEGIRTYLYNNYVAHGGLLPNLISQPSTMTLFGYALSKPLHIALPRNWLNCVKQCINKLKAENNLMSRCLGVMNLYYLCRMYNNLDLHQLSYEFVNNELDYLWDNRSILSSNARDISILGRSFLYGYRLLNYDASAYILNAANAYQWERNNYVRCTSD